MMRPRTIRAVVTVATLAALLLVIAASGASAAGGVPLEYSGKLFMEAPTGSVYPPSHNFGKFKVTLQWDATANTEDTEAWHFKEFAGTVHWDQKGAPPEANGGREEPPCDATLSLNQEAEDLVSVIPYDGRESQLEVSTEMPLGLVRSSTESSGGCSAASVINGWNYAGIGVAREEEEKSAAGIEAIELALRPKLIAKAGVSTTKPFDYVFNREIPTGASDPYVIEIHSSLHVGPGGKNAGGGGSTSSGKKGGGGKGGSGGSAACVVPKLVGKKLGAAKAALAKADCKLGKVQKPKGANPKTAKVVKQGKKPGTRLKAGAKVTVKLG
jgi:uncharacterized membrane protein YgcG